MNNKNYEGYLYEIDKKIDDLCRKVEILEALEASMQKLHNLIGLVEIKASVEKLTNYLKFHKRVSNKSNIDKINLNMIFKGNPGTGKTTVARLISDILYNLGYLENNAVAETTPRDFIGQYIGQTSIKAKELLEKYKGGIIFIDEAYGFVHEKGERNFADEALIEICYFKFEVQHFKAGKNCQNLQKDI